MPICRSAGRFRRRAATNSSNSRAPGTPSSPPRRGAARCRRSARGESCRRSSHRLTSIIAEMTNSTAAISSFSHFADVRAPKCIPPTIQLHAEHGRRREPGSAPRVRSRSPRGVAVTPIMNALVAAARAAARRTTRSARTLMKPPPIRAATTGCRDERRARPTGNASRGRSPCSRSRPRNSAREHTGSAVGSRITFRRPTGPA